MLCRDVLDMKFIVVLLDSYVVGPLLRDLLLTKFIVVWKEKSVSLQRCLFVEVS